MLDASVKREVDKMKVQLFFRLESLNSLPITMLTHIKVLGPDQSHLSFARITPELLEFIRSLELDVPEYLLIWKGKNICPTNLPTNS